MQTLERLTVRHPYLDAIDGGAAPLSPSILLLIALVALFALAYALMVWIGIWRAAKAYQGWPGWSILARTLVIISVIMNALTFFIVVYG